VAALPGVRIDLEDDIMRVRSSRSDLRVEAE
jgi:hypothetical protein